MGFIFPIPSDWSTGWVGSWNKNFIYPNGFPGQSGLSGVDAHMKVLTGTNDPQLLTNHFNLTAPKKIAKLLANKTEVLLEAGSHDNIVPWVDKWTHSKSYLNSGVPTEVRINYFSGHTPNKSAREERLWIAMNQLSNEILKGQAKKPIITNKLVTNYFLSENGKNESWWILQR